LKYIRINPSSVIKQAMANFLIRLFNKRSSLRFVPYKIVCHSHSLMSARKPIQNFYGLPGEGDKMIPAHFHFMAGNMQESVFKVKFRPYRRP